MDKKSTGKRTSEEILARFPDLPADDPIYKTGIVIGITKPGNYMKSQHTPAPWKIFPFEDTDEPYAYQICNENDYVAETASNISNTYIIIQKQYNKGYIIISDRLR